MNKNKILISVFLLIFLFSLNSVSAMDDSENILFTSDEQLIVGGDDFFQSPMDDSDEILSSGSPVVVNGGESIQSAIDNAAAGSTIIVESGNYSEDLVIPKELSIVGHDAILKSNKIAFNILPAANNTSISGFDISVSDINGTGIYVNASNCKITDNRISGGSTGILSELNITFFNSTSIDMDIISGISILRNNISDLATAGISIYAYNPIVSQNRVSNVNCKDENGTASGIMVNGIGVVGDDLKVIVTDNYVSNVHSLNTSYGFNIGGNSIFDSLTEFDVSGNVVDNVLAPVESYGMNIGAFSLKTTLPTINFTDLNISNVSSGDYENASVVGLSASVTTIGQNETSDAIVKNVNITNLQASGPNSSLTGIDATGVGCVDVYVLNNNLDSFKASGSVTGVSASGIDYTNFEAFIEVSNNNITNFEASKIKGINAFSLGNVAINKNILYNLLGDSTTFITGVPLSLNVGNVNITIPENATIDEIIELFDEFFAKLNNTDFSIDGNLSVFGNNLEGTGIETGFAVIMPSVIRYNRAVNLEYDVVKESTKAFILESYGFDPNMSSEEIAYMLLKSQKTFENCTEEELRNMSVKLGAFLDKFFSGLDKSTAGDVDARFNWWGTNSRPLDSAFKHNNGNIIYDPWLILRVNSNPDVINLGEFSKITADVYIDSLGQDHSSDADLYFSGPRVTLSTDLGSFNGKKSVTLDWINGQAIAYLEGDEAGLATVTAFDYDSATTTVLIRGSDSPQAKADAITMPSAGNPLSLLLVIAIVLLSSADIYRRK
ncbi:MAG: hypothetical protein IK044_05150 [Methanobrevibacter sp.]|nr:hypothetical protein [Methanobrevibacter sp.]